MARVAFLRRRGGQYTSRSTSSCFTRRRASCSALAAVRVHWIVEAGDSSFGIVGAPADHTPGNTTVQEDDYHCKCNDLKETECRVLIPTGRPVGFFLREYPRLFQDAWLRLLALPAPLEQCKPLFQFLPSHVMPFLSKPLMLADFYLRAFSGASAEVSVLSLSGLLLLLTKYGLGDPDTLSASASEFYAKLYDLVRPETLRLRRRARFQRLLAASLSSGLLPARFAAAFAKRCMRTAVLCQDSGSVMWLLSVAYTLIQRHHSHCEFLIHRRPEKAGGEEAPSTLQEDPFDAGAELPAAVESVAGSSLWELQLLRRHHSPAVATLTKLFLKPFFRPTAKKLDLELMLEQSTARLYMQALKAGERQASRWKFRGETCPLAFKVQDDEEANRVAGWASALSTEQRRIGAGK
ncbi:unnamed protein product [Prorocentrum cordatum]|uniref:CCAAT-binding factor domain-containing protein n=1 Tax=Prorocentrum cordatum TaxID=2364126 RepID=A0ABN9XN49_9DINO|nr:unnamed protein product [Polarella glacialis]